MTHIRTILSVGLAAYLLIALWQVALNPAVTIQAAALGLILVVLTAVAWISDEENLKKAEMGLLWIGIGLFALYAILTAGGIA